MANCNKCGAHVDDSAEFCPVCGAAVSGGVRTEEKVSDFTEKAAQKFADLNNTADTSSEYDPADINANKTMAILAYIIFLIPLFAAKESKFARFHTNQGIILVIASVAYGLVRTILDTIFYSISWALGSLVGTILGLASLVFIVLMIIGIINAANGKAKELPIIGKIRILK